MRSTITTDNNPAPRPPDAGYELLALLYQSIEEVEFRESFVTQLGLQLDSAIESVLVHNLADGSVATYAGHAKEQLFARQESPSTPLAMPDNQLRQSGSEGDLLFYPLQPEPELGTQSTAAATVSPQLGIAWSRGAWLVQLVVQPKQLTGSMDAFARNKAGLLNYVLPHLSAVFSISLKQQERFARFNGVRALQSILPLPLLVCRRRDGSLRSNHQARILINSLQPDAQSTVSPIKGLVAEDRDKGWKLVRSGSRVQLVSTASSGHLPPLRLHQLGVGDRRHYDVHLLGDVGSLAGGLNHDLLMQAFSLSAREAKLCACAIQSTSPQDLAEALNLSINTVKARLKPIYRALDVNSIAQLVVKLYFHPAYWTANYGRKAQPALAPTRRTDL